MITDKVTFKVIDHMLISENMEKNLRVDLRGCSVRFRIENETLTIYRNDIPLFTIPIERVAVSEYITYLTL